MLVDDDDDMRTSLRHFLADEGFDVHTARNGRDALTRLQDIASPGLILLDLMMPIMDGNEFLVERGRDDRLAKIPVIIMSAWTRDWNGDTVGVEAVLTKPINPEHLLTVVAQYCDRGTKGDPRRSVAS